MVAIALSLMLRTYADVWMIQTSTKIEAFNAIISRHKPRFWRSLTGYLLCMRLVSVINSFFEAESLRVEIALPRTADSPLLRAVFGRVHLLQRRGPLLQGHRRTVLQAAHCCWLTSQLQQRTVGGGGTKICRLFIGGLSHETTDEQIVPHSLRDRNVHSSTSKAKQFNERDESVRA
ncbi:hypothetical protein niasHS_005004 [Heterodera schachtii]|uniref:ABC transmembrane type-1 domain-containing protein n=1 Tax=Heterodera schachtii TaxID=97005 RepID=A0ABD2K0B0_HETSC